MAARKLTYAQAEAVRADYHARRQAAGLLPHETARQADPEDGVPTITELARRHGLTEGNMARLLHGITYRAPRFRPGKRGVPDCVRVQIVLRVVAGESRSQVAVECGVGLTTVDKYFNWARAEGLI